MLSNRGKGRQHACGRDVCFPRVEIVAMTHVRVTAVVVPRGLYRTVPCSTDLRPAG